MRALVFALSLSTALAGPAFAQREVNAANANPHDRIVREAGIRSGIAERNDAMLKPVSADKARKILGDFAKCAVKKHPGIAREFVLMNANEWLAGDKFAKIAGGNCLGYHQGQLTIPREYYRGALADRLVAVDFETGFVLKPDALAPLSWSEPTLPADTAKTASSASEALQLTAYNLALANYQIAKLSECIVRADPAGSAEVLKAAVDSQQELAALKSMNMIIAGCVASGQTISFNRTNLRNALAITYYRLASAQDGKGATS